jgi:hypothetical protein
MITDPPMVWKAGAWIGLGSGDAGALGGELEDRYRKWNLRHDVT